MTTRICFDQDDAELIAKILEIYDIGQRRLASAEQLRFEQIRARLETFKAACVNER